MVHKESLLGKATLRGLESKDKVSLNEWIDHVISLCLTLDFFAIGKRGCTAGSAEIAPFSSLCVEMT